MHSLITHPPGQEFGPVPQDPKLLIMQEKAKLLGKAKLFTAKEPSTLLRLDSPELLLDFSESLKVIQADNM